LRTVAAQAGVAHHGVLWLLDEFEREAVVASDQLHAGLTAISTHPRCRLPPAEVQTRLARFKP
jgi:hypothetical protein